MGLSSRITALFCVLLAAAALLAAGTAAAGPNAGGTLVVHDTGLVYTTDSAAYPNQAPACAGVDAQAPLGLPEGGAGYVWKVYAAFPPDASPRLKALVFGAQFPADIVVVAGGLPDPAADFEITQAGWPLTTGGGVGVSFGVVKTSVMAECYWLGGYAYGAPGAWTLASHPSQGMIFVDDSVPPIEDAITALGSLGFGQAGVVPCPDDNPDPGACCFADGSCQLNLPDACGSAGGIFLGGACQPNPCPQPPSEGACCMGAECFVYTAEQCAQVLGEFLGTGVPCNPNPCPTPVQITTWGRLKQQYDR